MTEIAFSFGNTVVYYSSVIIASGTASCFFLIWALYNANGGKKSVLCLFILLSTILSVIFSRILHWNCHSEQYESFLDAVTNYATGGYVLSGIFIGILCSYCIIYHLHITKDAPLILDCTAPGLAMLITIIRMSCLFNTSCRSKISVNSLYLQHLPFASTISDSAGNTEFRFATFFFDAVLISVLFIAILLFFSKLRLTPAKNEKDNSGSVWMMFLIWYSAIEIVMDSTRYDSSFSRFNGFVSVVQMFCGILMLSVLVFYSVRSVKADGLKAYHLQIWSGWFLALAGAGVCEYLVQRHGDWYISCYCLMSACLIIMSLLTVSMYKHQCIEYRPDNSH